MLACDSNERGTATFQSSSALLIDKLCTQTRGCTMSKDVLLL